MSARRILRLALSAAAGTAVSTVMACTASDNSSTSVVPASVSLVQTSSAASVAAADASPPDSAHGPITRSMIDSLMVTVTQVDVLPDSLVAACHPPEGDSARGFRPGPPPPDGGPMGPGGPLGPGRPPCGPGDMFGGPLFRPDHPPTPGDSLLPPDSGWGSRPNQWYALAVVGSGRIDLVHLPADTSGGALKVAADSLPAGNYQAARLLVDSASAKIWFNTVIVTPAGDTLKANTAYPVLLPGRPGEPRGIMTDAGFSVPTGGGTVTLSFDANAAIRGAIVTHNGTIIIGPMLRAPRH